MRQLARNLLGIAGITTTLLGTSLLEADDFIPRRQSAPPGPPLSPAEALKKMVVPAGFKVELVASEPQIQNPVAMAFDDRGRIFVTESFEYPRREPGPGKDRIKILEDKDGDGVAETVKIFAEGLNIPSGIAVGHGGVWVANAPDILFMEDTNGDDVADKSTVIVTGFGRDDTHELPNALTWGPDGCLYGLNGVFNRSVVKQNGRTFDFTCAMFRIDPITRKFDLFCEGTSNPWGIAFDSEGSAFVSACVIDHLWHLSESAYYRRQGGPYPPHTWFAESIVKHKHQMAAYCGIEYFDSAAYPEKYRNKLYMGNIHGGCINCDRIERTGATYQGFGEPDFLTSNDVWFMPVAQKVGPDGCLYILDWYDRYHCYQDANADPKGVDRGHGRLYRVVYENRPAPKVKNFATLGDEDLVALLADNNIFNRQRAQLELQERRILTKALSTAAKLQDQVLNEKAPMQTRLHSLWSLVGSGPLPTDFAMSLLRGDSPEIRSWGVKTIGHQNVRDAKLVAMIDSMAKDPDARVRVEVAIASPKLAQGQTGSADNIRRQIDVLRHSQADSLIARIAWQNMLPHMVEQQSMLLTSIASKVSEERDSLRDLSPRIATRLASDIRSDLSDEASKKSVESILEMASALSSKHANLAASVLESLLSRTRNGEIKADAIRPLLASWLKKNESKPEMKANLQLEVSKQNALEKCLLTVRLLCGDSDAIALASRCALDRGSDIATRKQMYLAAVQMSSSLSSDALSQILQDLKDSKPLDGGLRDQVMDVSIAKANAKDIEGLVAVLPSLKNDMQAAIAERMCRKSDGAEALLKLILDGKLRKELISPNRVILLASDKSESVKNAVSKIWGSVNSKSSLEREGVIQNMANALRWDARGSAERGWAVYDRICGQCHVMHARGNEVGPNITANGRGSYEQLLVSVFNPSLVIGEAYRGVTIRTVDGTVVTGLLVARNEKSTIVKVQGGKEETIPAEDIEEFKQNEKSLMPEGIENQMTPQELADLFALLTLEKQPGAADNAIIAGTPDKLHS